MKVPILSGNVAIAKHRCWHAYDAWRRIDWIINVVIKTFALNKNGDDSSIAYNIIKPNSSVSWKRNGLRFIWARPYRRLIRLRIITLDCGDDTGIQVVFQDLRADLVQRGIHRLNLADHIDTVRVLLHHADDPAQVSFNGFKPTESVFVFHDFLWHRDRVFLPPLTPPTGGG